MGHKMKTKRIKIDKKKRYINKEDISLDSYFVLKDFNQHVYPIKQYNDIININDNKKYIDKIGELLINYHFILSLKIKNKRLFNILNACLIYHHFNKYEVRNIFDVNDNNSMILLCNNINKIHYKMIIRFLNKV